ncbi:MAG: hypothetical protein ABH873_00225 [Candidatus Firestonebacteria bacterium]
MARTSSNENISKKDVDIISIIDNIRETSKVQQDLAKQTAKVQQDLAKETASYTKEMAKAGLEGMMEGSDKLVSTLSGHARDIFGSGITEMYDVTKNIIKSMGSRMLEVHREKELAEQTELLQKQEENSSKLLKRATTQGSIYTHDIVSEKLLTSTENIIKKQTNIFQKTIGIGEKSKELLQKTLDVLYDRGEKEEVASLSMEEMTKRIMKSVKEQAQDMYLLRVFQTTEKNILEEYFLPIIQFYKTYLFKYAGSQEIVEHRLIEIRRILSKAYNISEKSVAESDKTAGMFLKILRFPWTVAKGLSKISLGVVNLSRIMKDYIKYLRKSDARKPFAKKRGILGTLGALIDPRATDVTIGTLISSAIIKVATLIMHPKALAKAIGKLGFRAMIAVGLYKMVEGWLAGETLDEKAIMGAAGFLSIPGVLIEWVLNGLFSLFTDFRLDFSKEVLEQWFIDEKSALFKSFTLPVMKALEKSFGFGPESKAIKDSGKTFNNIWDNWIFDYITTPIGDFFAMKNKEGISPFDELLLWLENLPTMITNWFINTKIGRDINKLANFFGFDNVLRLEDEKKYRNASQKRIETLLDLIKKKREEEEAGIYSFDIKSIKDMEDEIKMIKWHVKQKAERATWKPEPPKGFIPSAKGKIGPRPLAFKSDSDAFAEHLFPPTKMDYAEQIGRGSMALVENVWKTTKESAKEISKGLSAVGGYEAKETVKAIGEVSKGLGAVGKYEANRAGEMFKGLSAVGKYEFEKFMKIGKEYYDYGMGKGKNLFELYMLETKSLWTDIRRILEGLPQRIVDIFRQLGNNLGDMKDASLNISRSVLGKGTSFYETGRKKYGEAAGTIGTGTYGAFQMTTATVKKFIEANDRFGNMLKGIGVQTDEFKKVWKELADAYGKEFWEAQRDYIKKTHLDPNIRILEGFGYDIKKRSSPIMEKLLSISTHFGKLTPVIGAFKDMAAENVNRLTDAEFFQKIHEYTIKNFQSLYAKEIAAGRGQGITNRLTGEYDDFNEYIKRSLSPGSIYTHDERAEGLLAKIAASISSSTANLGKVFTPEVRETVKASMENLMSNVKKPGGAVDMALAKINEVTREVDSKIKGSREQLQTVMPELLKEMKNSPLKLGEKISEITGDKNLGDTVNTVVSSSINQVLQMIPKELENLNLSSLLQFGMSR